MTYKRFKKLVEGLLTLDVALTEDNDVMLGYLEYAFQEVASKADSLHLMTINENEEILRTSYGKHMTRVPDLPINEDEELDIDRELIFPTARFVASYASPSSAGEHYSRGESLIITYNGKVEALLERLGLDEKGEVHVKEK